MLRYLSLAAVLMVPAPALAADAESAYREARDAYYALQSSSRKQLYRENWTRVIDRFARVHDQHADSRRGDDALFMVVKTRAGLYQVSRVRDDALAVVEAAERMASRYPQSSLSDDALMIAAELQRETLGDKAAAYLLYAAVVKDFAGGDMADKARQAQQQLADYKPQPAPQPEPAMKAAAPSSSQAPVASGAGTQLQSIRFWSNPGYTRVVLDLTQKSEFSAHFLAENPETKDPPRLYVDVTSARLEPALKEPTIVDDGLLRRIRTGTPEEQTVRVVLDLDSVGDYKVFPLDDPYRIVIDIAGKKAPELKRRETEIASLPSSQKDAIATVLDDVPKEQPKLHIPDAPVSSSLRRIVVDAGHGGKDPGAVGPNGTLEKDVTLSMAKKLAAELRKTLGCEVILTRSGDVYLPLEERTAIANKVGADLFISLHANANRNRRAYGVETYYLNFSKNDKAAAVAARENGTSLKQVSDLELILFDLMANAKINESSLLAAEIQKGLVSSLGRHYSDVRDLGVRQGPFYVLLGATMPSVLVEAAFISNHREEKRLKSSKYQDRTAAAIARAIKSYAVDHKMIASR